MGGSSVGDSGLGNRGGCGGAGGGVEGGGSKTGGGVGDGSVDDGVGISSTRGSVEVGTRGGLEEGVRISRSGGSSSVAKTVLVGAVGRPSIARGSTSVDEGVSRKGGASSCEVLSSKRSGVVLDVSMAITVRGGTETSGKVRMRAMLDRQKEECFILYSVP